MQVSDEHNGRPHPHRQDTFDLREQLMADDHHAQHLGDAYPSDEEHSVLEDDSDGEDRDDYMDDDDGSSSLSIPNESIDFDLVYALHSFAATVEGQANVVKGDSLFLMDDSNSYWWLVRVLKTQEVGYIPAENIETPFERLARLNKHRNVDLASATHTERQESVEHIRDNLSSRAGSHHASPSPTSGAAQSTSRNKSRPARGVVFTPSLSVHRYPPAVWGDEEEEDDDVSWDDEGYEDEDPELAEEQEERERAMGAAGGPRGMEPDDGMSWEDGAVENMQARKQVVIEGAPAAVPSVEPEIIQQISIPAQLQPGNQQTSPQRESVAPSSPGQSQQQPAAVAATQPPRDRVTIVSEAPVSVAPQDKSMDPTQAKDTRKISITPAVARDSRPEPQLSGPLLPSAIMQQQHDDRKRTREEIEALEDAARKKANQGKPIANSPSPQSKVQSGGKLRKPEPVTSEDDNSKDRKKKSGGVFGGLFGRRKDKGKDKSSPMSGSDSGSALGAGGSTEIIVGRGSEESGLSSSQQHSGITSTQSNEQVAASRQLQGQSQQPGQGVASDAQGQRQLQQARSPDAAPPSALQSQLSQHANQLRQRDQQQQALYLQYLNRSPATPPEAQPSYGLQSASAVLPATISLSSSSSGNGLTATPTKPRPGSLVLSPGAMDGQGVGLPDLSVVRVFAGDNLQTEATFKTVLLNSSTTASGLVRQAIQRFRLPSGENENDYYLTIKQLEGSSAALLPNEQPLGVFESLVEAAMELPKVKRSSVGSISSVASNLSMHPAIRKLSMNDFTDDSAVKFYLNRKADSKSTALPGDYGDETLQVESPRDEEHDLPRSPGQFLPAVNGVTPERFTSPSYKFALQLSIHPEDLPDDMVFDPLTEAIVFKNTLRDRSHTSVASASSGVSQMRRKKIFVFPKNVTVAEVIEIGLERFGIVDGVVDGGDEIEDKLTKRRSSSRVRYGLNIDTGTGREKELHPSSKVIDAYTRPPTYRAAEKRFNDAKRRSVDSAQLLLGSAEDVGPDDPIFTLRRAVTYRTARHRSSAPLDEIALQHLHRESMSNSSVASESTTGPSEEPRRQLSKQELIAHQRAQTRANQRAILSAQENSARGLDVRLPSNAVLRSSRYELDDRMRYSYVEPDGETTYDISHIVEEEWRERSDTGGDLLHGVLSRGNTGLGARLDRVLNKIRNEKGAPVKASSTTGDVVTSVRTTSPSVYSIPEGGPSSHSVTPSASQPGHRGITPPGHNPKGSVGSTGHRTTTPTQSRPLHGRQGSTTSTASGYRSPNSPASKFSATHSERQHLYIPKDYFEHKELMAVIMSRAGHRAPPDFPPLDPVDDLLFGRELDMDAIHPQIRDIYSGVYKQLEEMDNALDTLLQHVAHTF